MAKEIRFHSVFDIIGPIMVGPSSSHTAGAARIGKLVRKIFGEQPDRVDIYLYESFAKTYRGHGTDVALVAGLLDMEPEDPRLPDSMKIAYEKGMKVTFVPKSDKVDHPNTAKLILKKGDKQMSITGISIGGGNIQLSEIDGFKINLSMSTPTIITVHHDVPGMVARATAILNEAGINIATMTVSRTAKGEKAIMIIELDSRCPELVERFEALESVESVTYFD